MFLDESSANTKMQPLYARAPKDCRAIASVPQGNYVTVTMIAAVRLSGPIAAHSFVGTMNQERFHLWLSGFWKSVEPVREGRYGYIGIRLNQPVKDKLTDMFEFLDTGDHTKTTVERPGFLGYAFGKTDGPLYRLDDEGRPSTDSFELVDDNRMQYTNNNEKRVIEMIKIDEKDAVPHIK